MSDIEDFFEPLYGQLEHQDVTDFLNSDFLAKHVIYDIQELELSKPDFIPHGTFNVLVKHKFDVFGLIPKGLAISTHCFSFAN